MILKNKTLYQSVTIALFSIAVFCAFSFTGNDGFDLARQEIELRKIGHEVLLQSGDSTSRVLPVKKIAANEYQITFENEVTFQSDSLVSIIKRSLAKDHIPHDYIVNVLNCKSTDVLFGYAMSANEQNSIVPCSGRKQPKSCYIIDIKLQEAAGITPMQKGYLLGSVPLLAFVGLLLFSLGKKRDNQIGFNAAIQSFTIGQTVFDPERKELIFNETITSLTIKENKLLLIFAQAPNQIIERSRLQKEIWEDEGVIVGRSLDMFISKIRKKLEGDTTLQLENIHGKGYKLKTVS